MRVVAKWKGLEGNEGGVAEMWITCQEGTQVFTVYFWHSDGWSVRNETLMSTVLKRVANTRSHWTTACDANMDPTEFAWSDWLMSPEIKFKLRCEEAPPTVLCAWRMLRFEITRLLRGQ